MKIADVIKNGICKTAHLPPQALLDDAVHIMIGEKTSSILIRVKDSLKGIVTRSDILQCLAVSRYSEVGRLLPLQQVMTAKLITATPQTSVRQAMSHMSVAGIEHLPILENGRHLCTLHLYNLLQHHNSVLQTEIVHLQEYIASLQDAKID